MQDRRLEENPGREQKTLERLMPRLEARFADKTEPAQWEAYTRRVHQHFPALFRRLYALYGH